VETRIRTIRALCDDRLLLEHFASVTGNLVEFVLELEEALEVTIPDEEAEGIANMKDALLYFRNRLE
jgi:hypothetical protein